ncbi:unnamed protein product, partial [marine sediment metagenome]
TGIDLKIFVLLGIPRLQMLSITGTARLKK